MTAPSGGLDNFVQLQEGVPKRLHFTAHAYADREITDPVTRQLKRVTTLQLIVDEEDGLPVSKTLGVTAEGLAAQLSPYLSGQLYRAYSMTITRRGAGFSTRYLVEAIPRPT